MKIQCPCGHEVSDGGDALPNKAHFIADQEWDAFWDAVDAAVERSGPSPRAREAAVMRLRGLGLFRQAWQRSQCGRLLLDDTPTTVRVFTPEPGEESARVLGRRGR
ncbi:MAG TPA: hypothetical protein VHG91_15875 [Longimicrobium sp.]|nr:hypothetical protein [Longimicrobium sp.]